MPDPETRVTISDENGEVIVRVHKSVMSLGEMLDDLIVPALMAKGYSGAEALLSKRAEATDAH